MEFDNLIYLLLLALAALSGWLIAHLRLHKQLMQSRESNSVLVTTLELERKLNLEKITHLEQTKQEFSSVFSALASHALKSNSEEFLKLAQEKLHQFYIQAQGDLTQKEKAIEVLMKPIGDALQKTEQNIQAIEKERKEAYGAITSHLEQMMLTQRLLQTETQNLVKALRRPEVRGQWGELTLRRLAELAGMVDRCDFYEQEHTITADGALRPDMIVRMPGERELIVDVKTPLDAYLSAIEAEESQRPIHLANHARKVREHVKALASKTYWAQFKNSPDFVIMFIPGDQFLAAALDKDRELLEQALQQKIVLATPTSFVALLRAIAYGWQQQAVAENAQHIQEVGTDLYNRLAIFSSHLAKLGKSLGSSLEHYNRAVGSFERQVIPGARKFTEMGINFKKPVEQPEQIELAVRHIEE